jgi:two-component system sensor histidine kinase DesK
VAPHPPPVLTADGEAALYRCMQEALSNAVRHGAERRVDVVLDTEGEWASLTVIDDGPGFPDDTATRLRSRGGLAGIRERVGALGGEISIGNRDEGGAKVRVAIPLVPSAAPTHEASHE